jgi:hypothetical protein
MAHWFFEFQLPNLFHVDSAPKKSWRPTWMREAGPGPAMRPLG